MYVNKQHLVKLSTSLQTCTCLKNLIRKCFVSLKHNYGNIKSNTWLCYWLELSQLWRAHFDLLTEVDKPIFLFVFFTSFFCLFIAKIIKQTIMLIKNVFIYHKFTLEIITFENKHLSCDVQSPRVRIWMLRNSSPEAEVIENGCL